LFPAKKIMTILLINPPILVDEVMRDFEKFERMRGLYPPLGLLYVAAVVERLGHEVVAVDCDAEDDHLKRVRAVCEALQPDMVGFYAFTWNYRGAARLATLVKSICPQAMTVLGGPNATSFPEQSLRFGDFDVAVMGEGEETVKELLDAVGGDRPLHGIAGIAFKEGEKVVQNPPREFIGDLDAVPFPARRLVPMDRYHDVFTRERKFATMIATRGCPFQCTFCNREARLGRLLRARSPENVVEEIGRVKEAYGIREFMFFDDNFILDKEWAHGFCRALDKSGFDVLWEIRTRVDTVDEDVLKALRDAGCYRIRFGFEAGDDAILRNLKKGITVDQSLECARLCHKTGIEMFGYFILGAPGETEETMLKTIDLAVRIDPRFALFSKFVPYPRTEAFDWAASSGYIERDYWIDFIAGRNLDSHPALDQNQLPSRVVEEYLGMANRRFYFRPRYLARMMREIKNPSRFWQYLRIARSLL
jgi:radical SAM superfamily enzyme YgiQ (UPF0313 family)